MSRKAFKSRFLCRYFNCIALITLTIILIVWLRYFAEQILQFSPRVQLFNLRPNKNDYESTPITILFWSTMYARAENWESFWFKKTKIRTGCPHLKCVFTSDRSMINKSDGVLFHGYKENLDKDDFPQFRLPHQRWILFMNEPPEYPARNYSEFNGLFNWTMSYRRDSDVFGGYGNIVYHDDEDDDTFDNDGNVSYAFGKTEVAAWFVSHCRTNGKREDYVRELQKYIPVHIYGRCGTGEHRCDERFSERCYKLLETKYKFYLSFENSLCKDYVTEKFYDILPYNVVPVIFNMGHENLMVPSGGYVDAMEFLTPKDLAEYLLMIHRNDYLYNRFFDWKRGKIVRNTHFEKLVCDLCEKLRDRRSTERKVYDDLQNWWFRESNCHYWKSNKVSPFR